MALTNPERRIIADILELERLARINAGDDTSLGEFFDLTPVQQKNFLRPRVQTRRDAAQVVRNNIDTEATARKVVMDALLSVLDSLLVKLV